MDFQDKDFNLQWNTLLDRLSHVLGKKPDMNALLFLIGVQELGKGNRNFTKEQKMDLMHIATCKLLSLVGYFRLTGQDSEGWPHWEQIRELPNLGMHEQEKLLKMMALEYFERESDI